MLKARFFTLVGIVVTAAAMRLIPHVPNFTPIAALALFGGAHFTRKKTAFGVTLAAMYLSDLFLGFFVYHFGWYHGTMLFVYGSFALTVCMGFWIRRKHSILRIAGAALASSVLFFLVTNFGVWMAGNLYPRTGPGLIACYVAAIPFFRNMLVGNAVYSIVLFGGFSVARKFWSPLREEDTLVRAQH